MFFFRYEINLALTNRYVIKPKANSAIESHVKPAIVVFKTVAEKRARNIFGLYFFMALTWLFAGCGCAVVSRQRVANALECGGLTTTMLFSINLHGIEHIRDYKIYSFIQYLIYFN